MARNIAGLWTIIQTNDTRVSVDVDNKPDGTFAVEALIEGRNVAGRGTGRVDGDQVHMTITWDDGPVGAYNGAFDGAGFLHGAGFDIKNPRNVAGWSSSRSF